jgi:hypothetical protein
MLFSADFASAVVLDNPDALISFHLGTFDILFNNASSLSIVEGTMELNTLRGASSAGVIRQLHFTENSSLQIRKAGITAGLLRVAPNFSTNPLDIEGPAIDFDNETSSIFGDGDIQFRQFDMTTTVTVINTTLEIQNNGFVVEAPMVEIFMQLTYFINQRALIISPDADILAIHGTLDFNNNLDPKDEGELVAFCPARNGSIVALSQGDHDVFYNSSVAGGPLDQVRGYDALGRVFTISNCDATTRTPPAPASN